MTQLSGFRAQLHEPGPLYAAMILMPDPAVASILGSCGFDFVIVDVEHGPFSLTSLRVCMEAFDAVGSRVVARTASSSEVEIKQLLDLGFDGVVIPKVETAAQTRAVIQAARYAPEGLRGVSRAVRAARWGLDSEYVAASNARTAVIVMIESRAGVANIDEIVATPGLDGVFVGPEDLAADLALSGDSPTLSDAMEKVIHAARAAGLKVTGGYEQSSPTERDFSLVPCFVDTVGLAVAAREALKARSSAA